mgnify:CR=1 FL=1
MITVTIHRSNDSYAGFKVVGHAGYAEEGYDIICAAVSVLVFNTLNAIESYTDDTMNVVTNDEAGLVDVVFESPVSDRAKLLLDTMILGLTGIEKQYGKKFLRLKFEEV